MKTITFYSYKGGVGRTLALANIAERLSEFKRKVCILDFDLEAPGVPFKFKDSINIPGIKTGIVDYIHEFQQTYTPPDSIIEYSIKIMPNKRRKSPIVIIPAGNSSFQGYWNKLSGINWNDLLYKEESKGVAFFLDLKNKIEKEINPDVLLVDSRTGISEISGIPLSIMADEVVLMASNNEENKYGIIQIMNSLTHPDLRLNEKSPEITVVLTRLPFISEPKNKVKETSLVSSYITSINDALLKNGNPLRLNEVLVIHSDSELELQESFKIGYETDEGHSIGTDYLILFSKLTSGILHEHDVEMFNRLKLADKYYNLFLSSTGSEERISAILKAISYDKTNPEFFFQLSNEYDNNLDYPKALKSIETAIKLNPKELKYYTARGNLNFHNYEYEKMLTDFTTAFELNPNSFNALFGLGLYYTITGDFQKGLEWYQKAIEKKPNDPILQNNIACLHMRKGDLGKAYDHMYKALSI
ncbi:MAG: tetratricopeptide repeat protein, partial [Bacteroidales bacterium]|nr:tetratricopeptide repeat protein [Bacteroidales bacterium]